MGKVKTAKRFATGAAIAGAAGYIAGLLTAPSSGRKTRDELKKSAESGIDDIEKQLKSLQSELGSLVDSARHNGDKLSGRSQQKFGDALESAKTSKDKLRDVLNAVHDGQADDSDLKKALKDAKHAIDHLKDFLSK